MQNCSFFLQDCSRCVRFESSSNVQINASRFHHSSDVFRYHRVSTSKQLQSKEVLLKGNVTVIIAKNNSWSSSISPWRSHWRNQERQLEKARNQERQLNSTIVSTPLDFENRDEAIPRKVPTFFAFSSVIREVLVLILLHLNHLESIVKAAQMNLLWEQEFALQFLLKSSPDVRILLW